MQCIVQTGKTSARMPYGIYWQWCDGMVIVNACGTTIISTMLVKGAANGYSA
jgi:hypothetical protein